MRAVSACLVYAALLAAAAAAVYAQSNATGPAVDVQARVFVVGRELVDGRRPQLVLLRDDDDDARFAGQSPVTHATFRNLAATGNGWCELYLNATTGAGERDEDTLYAAGYAEGALTVREIGQYYDDVIADWYVDGRVPPAVAAYVDANWEWTRDTAQAPQNAHDPFWREVRLLVAQLEGLYAGYQSALSRLVTAAPAPAAAQRNLTLTDLLYLNLDGDMSEIVSAFTPSLRRSARGYAYHPVFDSHCSSLVRVPTARDTIFHAHDTWSSFDSMLRVYKVYAWSLQSGGAGNGDRRVSFSSSPGFLSSVDDWYLTHHQLVISETTNNIYNETLYDDIAGTGGRGVLMTWVRAMVANALATTAQGWADTFVQYLSGTYPNQWIITDLKRFTPGAPLPPSGLTVVVEEMPGYSESADVTQSHLADAAWGFWPSFNVAYFPRVREWMGYTAMERTGGDEYSWSKCARARIFARDAPGVQSRAAMQRLMLSNDWQSDPLSGGDPYHAIMARGDLNPVGATADGGIDSKLTDYASATRDLTCYALCGPTYQTQPVFTWTTGQFDATAHAGQPDTFQFAWTPMCLDPSKRTCAK